MTVYLHGFIEANVCLLGFWSLRCALAKSRHQHGNVADGDQIAAAEAKTRCITSASQVFEETTASSHEHLCAGQLQSAGCSGICEESQADLER